MKKGSVFSLLAMSVVCLLPLVAQPPQHPGLPRLTVNLEPTRLETLPAIRAGIETINCKEHEIAELKFTVPLEAGEIFKGDTVEPEGVSVKRPEGADYIYFTAKPGAYLFAKKGPILRPRTFRDGDSNVITINEYVAYVDQKWTVIVAGVKPPDPPTPPDPPDPPKPPDGQVKGAWVLIVHETSSLPVWLSKYFASEPKIRFETRGLKFRTYDPDDPDAKAKGYSAKAKELGVPTLVVLHPDGRVLKAIKCPEDSTGKAIDAEVKAVTGL